MKIRSHFSKQIKSILYCLSFHMAQKHWSKCCSKSTFHIQRVTSGFCNTELCLICDEWFSEWVIKEFKTVRFWQQVTVSLYGSIYSRHHRYRKNFKEKSVILVSKDRYFQWISPVQIGYCANRVLINYRNNRNKEHFC